MTATETTSNEAGEVDLEIIRSLPILQMLPEALRDLVVGSFELRSYGFGEYVVRTVEEGGAFYVLVH